MTMQRDSIAILTILVLGLAQGGESSCAAALLTLRCGGQSVDLPVPKATAQTSEPVTRDVTLAAEDVTLTTDGYVNLLALQLIAEDGP